MNADGSPGVGADLALGIRLANIVAFGWLAIAIGMILVVAGGILAYRGLRRPSEPETVVDLRQPVPTVGAGKELAGRS